LNNYKADVLDSTVNPYHGSSWGAQWRATDGEQSGSAVEVTDAVFLSASGGNDDIEYHLDPRMFTRPQQAEGVHHLVGQAIARGLTGTWTATASFGWPQGIKVKNIGDTFSSDSDEFSHGPEGDTVVEVPVKLKVRASYRKRDGTIRVMSSFTA